jgi:hypothetical protein
LAVTQETSTTKSSEEKQLVLISFSNLTQKPRPMPAVATGWLARKQKIRDSQCRGCSILLTLGGKYGHFALRFYRRPCLSVLTMINYEE